MIFISNYVAFHVHTEDSLLDSCTNYKLYCDKAAELGQTAICFTEHGNTYNHIEKKMYANKKGLKYIHGVEIYLTATLDEKVRDNYHTILIAKNYEGIKEINLLVDKSTQPDHVYYKPRISFEEFFNISDNVIKISACLASPLNKYPSNTNSFYEEIKNLKKEWEEKLEYERRGAKKEYRTYCEYCWDVSQYDLIQPTPFEEWETERIGDINTYYSNLINELELKISICKETYNKLLQTYDYYEIQPHVKSIEQIKYNQMLYEASKKYGIPLIAGTDTHSINRYKAECRSILQKAKRIEFSNEDEFDLTYKSYEELVEMFRQQGSLPMDVILEAIENTNKMAEIVEDYEIDTSFKYPILYENEEEVFIERIYRMYRDKLDKGIIKPNPKYEENIQEELRVFKKIGMVGFMLFMSELVCWCWENDIPIGFCRGSVGGSTIAYLTDIIDVDPIVWNTVFSRFANEDRKEIGDIDLDIAPSQRHLVYEHIIEEFGLDNTAYILAIGTISDKGTIDEIGRGLNIPLDKVKEIKQEYDENPEKTKKKYSDIFYYFDGLVNTAISQSMHPAGIIVSPITLPDNYGTFWSKDGKRIICINMEEVHEVSLVKYDLLGLKNIDIIKECCKLAKIPYPKSHLVNWEDEEVWKHMADSPVGIFQFESKFAYDSLKKFGCKRVNDLSLVNASIRPSGESYRDRLLDRQSNKNPSEIIDDLLSANNGFLVFQEDTIKFLTNICGLSGSDADNIRRAIGRKQKDRLDATLPSILEGYCSKSDKPRDIAEQEAHEFLQIIEDSSNYQFGYNHSTGYSMIGYICGYLRYYYPKEFITSYLNFANNEDDIKLGTELAKLFCITIHSIKFRHSTAKYSCDNEGIYKGVSSVKFLNDDAANDLYSIKDEVFDTFINLLARIDGLKVDSRKLEILIKLDFFSEFGGINYLLKCNEVFNKYFGKKQMKKEKIFEEGIDFDVVRKYANKETPKMFSGLDSVGLINELIQTIPNEKSSIKTIIAYQLENLGYVDVVDKKYSGYCVVTDLNVDYSPKVKLYALANGNTIPVKIDKKTFRSIPLKRGDIVKVERQAKKPKMRKINNQWVESEEKEWWVTEYKVC